MKITDIKTICNDLGIAPSKMRGQNFLFKDDVLDKIVAESNVSKKDNVLEIGPGLGVLTKRLADKANKVMAVEVDNKVYQYLEKEFKNTKNLELVHKDIIDIPNQEIFEKLGQYKIVANIPYSITGLIFKKFVSSDFPPKEIYLLVQDEVAKKYQLGKKSSKIALITQFYGGAKTLFKVKKENFWPEPSVDSAFIKIGPIKPFDKKREKEFLKFVKIGFLNKRKKLIKNLKSVVNLKDEELKKIFKDLDINENDRAEHLSFEKWVELVKSLV